MFSSYLFVHALKSSLDVNIGHNDPGQCATTLSDMEFDAMSAIVVTGTTKSKSMVTGKNYAECLAKPYGMV